MVTFLVYVGIGFVAGAVCTYLIARNSPEHFLKAGRFVDTVYQMTGQYIGKKK